jgi:hypothetical protein
MNTENLNTQELETLRTLLNKMAGESKPKIFFDPVGVRINEILDEFNFAKVHKTMVALDWKWGTLNGGKDIPTIEELRATAERLLRGAAEYRLGDYKDEHWKVPIVYGTGGFQATAYCDEDKNKITSLELKFIVEEWDVDLECLDNE